MRLHYSAGVAVTLLAAALLSAPAGVPDYRAGSLAKQEPQAIYSADLHDPWNRIFYLLFTRTVQTRLAEDFKGKGPFVPTMVMGNPSLLATSQTFERIENGDRAIDPLYPNFLSSTGSAAILTDPGFSEMKQALREACSETSPRLPLARALMQADVWAAYNIVRWSQADKGQMGEHARALMPLLDQFIRKLALSSDEIAALPHNYQASQSSQNLPLVFDEKSGWMEVEWFPERSHDREAGNRHAARIFLKPTATPQSFLKQVNGRIQTNQDPLPGGIQGLRGAALITEVLLIDRSGRVVPSPLISDVQLRTVTRDGHGNFQSSTVTEFELSRRAMLSDPASGGFIHRGETEPAYLPSSGNDFTFASRMITEPEPKPPVLGTLRRRCESCHFESTVFTFQIVQAPGHPTFPVRQLRPSDDRRALDVANQKMQAKDFKSLHLEE